MFFFCHYYQYIAPDGAKISRRDVILVENQIRIKIFPVWDDMQ